MRLRDVVTGTVYEGEDGSGPRASGHAAGLRTAREGPTVWVFCRGETYRIERAAVRGSAAVTEAGHDLVAPMPGKVRAVLVAEGDSVGRGATLLLLEAMKMEHPVRAPRDGVVSRLRVSAGAMVAAGERLLELE
jgi:3-methylcrotonyl-CoA carboxylase alpha subunit